MTNDELTDYICNRLRDYEKPLDKEFWDKFKEWQKIYYRNPIE